MAVVKQKKDDIQVLFENIIFYAIFFICLILIASFGLIAES